jgi:hypothetical protein
MRIVVFEFLPGIGRYSRGRDLQGQVERHGTFKPDGCLVGKVERQHLLDIVTAKKQQDGEAPGK